MKNYKKIKIIICVFTLTIIMFNSCKKDESTNPSDNKGTSSALFNPNKTYGTMTDQDGNVYKTITIGTQTWMAENLRVTKYRNGDTIPKVTDNTAWKALTNGAYCNYNNSINIDTIVTYGGLYNWFAVNDNRSIAPVGWHVPTFAEWTTLITYLSGDNVAGGKMKEIGTTHWKTPNTDATNESGFTALPVGYRLYGDGYFHEMFGWCVIFWSSTTDVNDCGECCYIKYDNGKVDSNSFDLFMRRQPGSGFSLRCVKD